MKRITKVLILTIAYGQGHKSAAEGIAEEYLARGCKVLVSDPCEADKTGLYALTKAYYKLCVRRAPWLWAMAYAQTDTADWRSKITWPGIKTATIYLADLLLSWRPDVVICTYPLYAYMMDYLSTEQMVDVPYAVVVTDSLEISRPWVKSCSRFLFVPDEFSAALIRERYGLPRTEIIDSGFPVRKAFRRCNSKCSPSALRLNILYGAYLCLESTVRQIRGIFDTFPHARIVLLGGGRCESMKQKLDQYVTDGSLTVLRSSEKMPELFATAHIYIGKTGAATMFEAYASGVPFIANYALPGQEQGNLQLLLKDGAGCWAEETGSLCSIIQDWLCNDAEKWRRIRMNMLTRSERVHGAKRIADILELKLYVK